MWLEDEFKESAGAALQKIQIYRADPRNLSDTRRVRAWCARCSNGYFHILVKLKSKSVHVSCFTLMLIPCYTCKHPISKVLSVGSSCFLRRGPIGFVCLWVCTHKNRAGAACQGSGVSQTLQPIREGEAGDDLGWRRHRCYECPEPRECLCPKSARCREPLCVSRLDNAPHKTSFFEYFLISCVPREG